MALAKKLIMVVMVYRSMAQNLSSMMGILLKPKMNMNLVVVRVKVMRLMLIYVTFLMKTLVLGRVQNSSGSGLHFRQSSGSGLIGFANFSKVRVRVYRVLVLNFGFSGLSGSGF